MSEEQKVITEEEDLQYALSIRRTLVSRVMDSAKTGIPQDNLSASILLDSLTSIERNSIAKMRIKSDNKASTGSAAIIAQALAQINMGAMKRQDEGTIPTLIIPEGMKELSLVPGETEIGTKNVDIQAIMNGTGETVQPDATSE